MKTHQTIQIKSMILMWKKSLQALLFTSQAPMSRETIQEFTTPTKSLSKQCWIEQCQHYLSMAATTPILENFGWRMFVLCNFRLAKGGQRSDGELTYLWRHAVNIIANSPFLNS